MDEHEYLLTSDGQLYHWGWKKKKHKYIKRERKNGKWVYTYPDDLKDEKSENTLASVFKNLFGNKESDNKTVSNFTAAGKSTIERSYKSAEKSNSLNDKLDKAKSWFASKKNALVKDILNTADRVTHKTAKANDKAKKWVNNLFEGYQDKAKTAKYDYNTALERSDVMTERANASWNLYAELKKSGKYSKEETATMYKAALKADQEAAAAKRKAKEAKDAYKDAMDHPLRKLDDWLSRKTGEADEKKSVSKTDNLSLLKKKEKPSSADDDMAVINPKYQDEKKRSLYDENCAVCTMAYDLRRRGYDVVASDEMSTTADGMAGLSTKEITKVYKNCNRSDIISSEDLCDKYGKTNKISKKLEYLEKEMLEHGEGARANLMVKWNLGGGHSVAMEVENGKVVVRDCQTNSKYTLDYYAEYIREFYYLRTDTLEPSEEMLRYIINREGSKKK